MSTIRATYIQHGSSAVPNITLNASGDVVIASGITVTGSITASGFVSSSSVVIPSGSAAAPGIYFAGDTDTGLFTASGNTIAVTTSGTERLRVDDGGRLLVGTSSANANGGVLQLSGGITFPATAVAASDANTLDDYEEGTFTPTLTATTGSVSGYGAQSGTYKKIGSLVVCNIYLYLTNKGTLSGALKVDSLPFTGASGLQMQGVATYYLGMAINVVEVTCFSSSGTFVNLRRSTAASTANNTTLDSSEINNNFEIMMMLTYFV